MKKKVVMVCMLMTSICSLYAQNVTLAPEMGIFLLYRDTDGDKSGDLLQKLVFL